jgi:hypothetical protein
MNRFFKKMITTSLIVLITIMFFSVSWAQRAPEPVMPPSPVLAPAAECPPCPPCPSYQPTVHVYEPAVITTPPLASFRPKTTVPRLQPATAGTITPVPARPHTPIPSVIPPPLAQFRPTSTVPLLQPATAGHVTPTPIRPVFYTPPYYRIAPPAYVRVSHLPEGQVAQAPATSQIRVYVNNRLMETSIPSRGQVYVSLEDFLTAGDFYWENRGGVVAVTTGRGPRSPITVVPASYTFQNRPFSVHTFMFGGRPFVNARLLARQVNMSERFTQAANVYDFYRVGVTVPVRIVQDGTQPATETAAGTQAEVQPVQQVFKDDIRASFIQPKNDFFVDTSGIASYPVRGEVNYRNIGKDVLTNASVLFKIVDGSGDTIFSEVHSLGTMAPGAVSKKFDYYYLNPVTAIINESSFRYEITYTGPPVK